MTIIFRRDRPFDGHKCDHVTLAKPGSRNTAMFFCPAEVPDDVLAKVVEFARVGYVAYDMSGLAERIGAVLTDCYGSPHGNSGWPAGDGLRHLTHGRKSERDQLAQTLADYLGRDIRDLDTTPDWVLAWCAEDVRKHVRDEADDVDVFDDQLRIDLGEIWTEVAREVAKRLAACGLTPPETPEEEPVGEVTAEAKP